MIICKRSLQLSLFLSVLCILTLPSIAQPDPSGQLQAYVEILLTDGHKKSGAIPLSYSGGMYTDTDFHGMFIQTSGFSDSVLYPEGPRKNGTLIQFNNRDTVYNLKAYKSSGTKVKIHYLSFDRHFQWDGSNPALQPGNITVTPLVFCEGNTSFRLPAFNCLPIYSLYRNTFLPAAGRDITGVDHKGRLVPVAWIRTKNIVSISLVPPPAEWQKKLDHRRSVIRALLSSPNEDDTRDELMEVLEIGGDWQLPVWFHELHGSDTD